MNLDVNICSVCKKKNFSDREYISPMKMCNDCFIKQQTKTNPKVKNGISYDQTTPIEFKDKIKVWVDEDTDLIWEVKQKNNIDKTFTWKEAKEWAEYLNGIKYGGFNDWRVPTRYELESLCNVHYGMFDSNYSAWGEKNKDKKNNGYFIKKPLSKNTKNWYWTSTTCPDNSSGAYFVSFDRGSTGWGNKTGNDCVRCVRSRQ